MRRPRGPGGRFLTADEIAAQKVSSSNDHSNPVENDTDDIEDDDPVQATPDHTGIMYPLQSHPAAVSQSSQSQSQSQSQSPPALYRTLPQRPKGSTNSTPVTLSSPYPIVQLLNVPHPHVHTRPHHSNINFAGLYDNRETNAAEIQRAEDIVPFGEPRLRNGK